MADRKIIVQDHKGKSTFFTMELVSEPLTLVDKFSLALELLKALIDDEECQYDHDGDCQTHHRDQIESGECVHTTARMFYYEMIKEMEEQDA